MRKAWCSGPRWPTSRSCRSSWPSSGSSSSSCGVEESLEPKAVHLSARAAAILVVLLAVLGGAALLFQRQESASRPDNASALGKRVLPDLKVADVAGVRI